MPGSPRGPSVGHEDSPSGWLRAPGDVLGLLSSHFPARFCFPQLPSGSFSRICFCRSLSLGSYTGLSTQPLPRQCTGAVCRGGLGRHCLLGAGVCVCVSSLTPLPPRSLLLFCLNGTDALLLGGLLSSFQAFGFGVYCFFFLPALHKQTQPLAASLMPTLRVC